VTDEPINVPDDANLDEQDDGSDYFRALDMFFQDREVTEVPPTDRTMINVQRQQRTIE
jgi:hypothetical protein